MEPPFKKRERLDVTLVERKLFANRTLARTVIMDGGILVNGKKITKPGEQIKLDDKIEIRSGWETPKYVSRGGAKLEKALKVFEVNPSGRICLDIGASTGGFTDCLLQHNALLVHAIDVGYGQLDWKLRQDSRVVTHERINARYLDPEKLYQSSDALANLAVMDVSFISITKVLPACINLLKRDFFDIVCLIKPQFEAQKQQVEKGGIIKNKSTHIQVLENIVQTTNQLGLFLHGLTYSPITGATGNIEFLGHFTNTSSNLLIDIQQVVNDAHADLKGDKSN